MAAKAALARNIKTKTQDSAKLAASANTPVELQALLAGNPVTPQLCHAWQVKLADAAGFSPIAATPRIVAQWKAFLSAMNANGIDPLDFIYWTVANWKMISAKFFVYKDMNPGFEILTATVFLSRVNALYKQQRSAPEKEVVSKASAYDEAKAKGFII